MRFEIERHQLLAVAACAAEELPQEDPLAAVLVFNDAIYATDYKLAISATASGKDEANDSSFTTC